MDRASGSGVFARDPDALIDLIELELTEDVLKQQEDVLVCKTCYKWIKRFSKDNEVSQDDLCSARTMLELSAELLQSNTYKLMIEDIKKVKDENKSRTAWRIEGTLREFPKFEPIDLWSITLFTE